MCLNFIEAPQKLVKLYLWLELSFCLFSTPVATLIRVTDVLTTRKRGNIESYSDGVTDHVISFNCPLGCGRVTEHFPPFLNNTRGKDVLPQSNFLRVSFVLVLGEQHRNAWCRMRSVRCHVWALKTRKTGHRGISILNDHVSSSKEKNCCCRATATEVNRWILSNTLVEHLFVLHLWKKNTQKERASKSSARGTRSVFRIAFRVSK